MQPIAPGYAPQDVMPRTRFEREGHPRGMSVLPAEVAVHDGVNPHQDTRSKARTWGVIGVASVLALVAGMLIATPFALQASGFSSVLFFVVAAGTAAWSAFWFSRALDARQVQKLASSAA